MIHNLCETPPELHSKLEGDRNWLASKEWIWGGHPRAAIIPTITMTTPGSIENYVIGQSGNDHVGRPRWYRDPRTRGTTPSDTNGPDAEKRRREETIP